VRGRGQGRALVAEGLARTGRVWPGAPLRISAQSHLQRFYGGFGFRPAGAEYLEDGIPHVEMLRPGERP
jgi:ElaA protein